MMHQRGRFVYIASCALAVLFAAYAFSTSVQRRAHPQSNAPARIAPLSTECSDDVQANVRVDSGHPWQPPFGLDRVGAAAVVHVELPHQQAPCQEYIIVAYRNGKEVSRHVLHPVTDRYTDWPAAFRPKDILPSYDKVELSIIPEEVALYAHRRHHSELKEITRQNVQWPEIEIDATARPDRLINPVDLGTVLVPHNDLLLASGQTAVITAAALSHTRNLPQARLRAWFEDGKPVEIPMPLEPHQRVTSELRIPNTVVGKRSKLHVSLLQGDHQIWSKTIDTMNVSHPPHWPAFGAIETKLRYDKPISVQDPWTGKFGSLDYNDAWRSELNDVVVFLPNGSRFVFWRGSSYIPFWAGAFGTGVCYQWAENLTKQDGAVDMPEPLMDKELRYGKVRIIESTVSRVHVRWTYQSADFLYQVFGDQATEDFYFYPDGFGTRVLTLSSAPSHFYQVSEFIVLTPQSAFPLEVLPPRIASVLFLDGEKEDVSFPVSPKTESEVPVQDRYIFAAKLSNPRQQPMIYRIFDHKEDSAAAIYFNPRDVTTPRSYKAFYDRGQLVTPSYWGSHWPLSRGKMTGVRIDDRIYASPAHNSLLAWVDWPRALFSKEVVMPDTLGRSRPMVVRQWAWLIAKTSASDSDLLKWAQSYTDPPSIEVTGARIDLPSYSPERRAIRLVLESSRVEIKVKPIAHTINPIFELDRAPAQLTSVAIDGEALPRGSYEWDGTTLWLEASIDPRGATVTITFRP